MRNALMGFLVFLLAGCATIPTHGPVLVGGPITVDQGSEVDYLPTGPADGATQREILDGFLAAGAAPQNNYRIARSFLTDSAALAWNPARETVVHGIYASTDSVSSSQLNYSTKVEARVDESGVYETSDARKPTTWTFGFARVAGEWRLNTVPDLTLVSSVAFASAYDEYTVYFYNHDRTAFIPDVRVFARQADPVTAIARAVIAGPSRYLPNASTAFPDGATLATAPVDVESGRALVDVSDDVSQASLTDQQHMLSQLGVSLGGLAGVASTSMTVRGAPLSITAIPGLQSNPRVNDLPLIVFDGRFGFASGKAIDVVESIGSRVTGLKPTAVSFDASTNAAVVGTRTGVYVVGDRTERVATRPSVVDPQIDGQRSAWWVSPNTPGMIDVVSSGRRATFGGPWSRSARISGLEMSREDARIAVAVEDKGFARLYVGAVETDDMGRPVSIDGYRRLALEADRIVDIGWADATHIAVLATTNRVTHAVIVTVGGGFELIGQPQNPARISGGNTGVAGLVVIAANGQLWKPRGAGWQSTGIPAEVLATQH